MKKAFNTFSTSITRFTGSPWAFFIALVSVIVWALCGPMFHYSEGWQMIINTGTTIITFLMVFLIQNSQNKDTLALHIKINQLIEKSEADNKFSGIEEMGEEELIKIKEGNG